LIKRGAKVQRIMEMEIPSSWYFEKSTGSMTAHSEKTIIFVAENPH
jgi:hypothetical protein